MANLGSLGSSKILEKVTIERRAAFAVFAFYGGVT
jgi:hypothetical protein